MPVRCITLKEGADQEGFRAAVRELIGSGIRPEHVVWQTAAAQSLFGSGTQDGQQPAAPVPLPREVADLISSVICHRSREKFALLYSLVWRVVQGERALLEVHSDPLVFRLQRMAKDVRRDIHKMHAFLRFRRSPGEAESYVAWFEPEHYILEAVVPFFVDRFPSFAWSILTPLGSLHWDCTALSFGPPGRRPDAPASDAFEGGWSDYYASTFNPARVNPTAMRREMPRKYWHNMPETKLIPGLIQSAASRVEDIMTKPSTLARKRTPEKALAARHADSPKTLEELNAIIAAAEPFVVGGRQAVFGEGRLHPSLAFVGEQPGDQEDLQGRPFVGPAGLLLSRAMSDAGIERENTYVTNAVKHFKFTQRGKRRLHQKPNAGEVRHYRWWLEREMDIVQPKLIVALGTTAVLALTGKALPITRFRGPAEFDGHAGFITVHPSYLLRIPEATAKREAYAAFVADLKQARKLAEAA